MEKLIKPKYAIGDKVILLEDNQEYTIIGIKKSSYGNWWRYYIDNKVEGFMNEPVIKSPYDESEIKPLKTAHDRMLEICDYHWELSNFKTHFYKLKGKKYELEPPLLVITEVEKQYIINVYHKTTPDQLRIIADLLEESQEMEKEND